MAADPEQAAEEEDLGPDGGGYPDTNEIRERNRCNCVEFKRGRCVQEAMHVSINSLSASMHEARPVAHPINYLVLPKTLHSLPPIFELRHFGRARVTQVYSSTAGSGGTRPRRSRAKAAVRFKMRIAHRRRAGRAPRGPPAPARPLPARWPRPVAHQKK